MINTGVYQIYSGLSACYFKDIKYSKTAWESWPTLYIYKSQLKNLQIVNQFSIKAMLKTMATQGDLWTVFLMHEQK